MFTSVTAIALFFIAKLVADDAAFSRFDVTTLEQKLAQSLPAALHP